MRQNGRYFLIQLTPTGVRCVTTHHEISSVPYVALFFRKLCIFPVADMESHVWLCLPERRCVKASAGLLLSSGSAANPLARWRDGGRRPHEVLSAGIRTTLPIDVMTVMMTDSNDQQCLSDTSA